MVRNVIFDLDGTLVDSIPGIQWSVEAALAACGVPTLHRDLKPLIGPPIRDILAAVSGASDAATLDRMELAFRSVYDSGGWRKTTCQPGARGALERLRTAGCGLWVVTNKPGHAARAILSELALADYFEEIVCRDSRTPRFASKAEMLANLLERCAFRRAQSIMVGDTLEDCRAAEEAGIDCALVPHGYGGGLDGPLPERCRLIAGWNELSEWCEASDAKGDDPSSSDTGNRHEKPEKNDDDDRLFDRPASTRSPART
jgi:phosphoglycolate phosphatase